jgi:hypothetical protein
MLPADIGTLNNLYIASYVLRDGSLTRALLEVLQNREALRDVRLTALAALATHGAPDLLVTRTALNRIAANPETAPFYTSVPDIGSRDGSVPITPSLVAEIKATLRSLALSDDRPLVLGANFVLGQLEAREN